VSDQDRFGEGDPLPDTVRLWPDERRGPFYLTLGWQVIRGRAECVRVELRSVGTPLRRVTGVPVTAAHIRALRIGQIIDEDRASMADILTPADAAAYRAPQLREATAARLAKAAAVYRQAHAASRKPTRAVAEHFKISDSAAAKLVARARAARLLPATTPGVAVSRAGRRARPRKDSE
jgi:hypothetical protein